MSYKKHIPERTCLGCRSKLHKSDLLRFVLKENDIILDKGYNAAGRGVYLCKECAGVYEGDECKDKRRIVRSMIHELNKSKKYEKQK